MGIKISALTTGGSLDGTEQVEIVQSGVSKKTTTQDIANLGGGGGVTSVTYAELVVLIGASGLTTGAQYLITDYATVHYIVDANGDQYLSDIITGVTEPLIVTANSISTLDKYARSALHPEDILHYDWNPDNWVDDKSFADLSGTPTIIEGFKGVIYVRHDTLQNVYVPSDFRNIKYRSWKHAVIDYDATTLYAINDWVKTGGYIYISLVDSNINNTPIDGSSFWVQLYNLSLTEYWCSVPSGMFNQLPVDNASWIDTLMFAEGTGTATYEKCVRNFHIASFKDDSTDSDVIGTIVMNHVYFLQDRNYFQVWGIDYGGECTDFRVGGSYFWMTFGNKNKGMTWGDSNNGMTWGNYNTAMTWGNNNSAMTWGNYNFFMRWGNNNANMTWGNANNAIIFGNGNNAITWGNWNNDMRWGNSNSNMTFGNYAYSNDIFLGDSWVENTVENNVHINLDFSSATHVYNNYSCTIFKRADGTAKLSYCNNSDVIVVVSANV